MTKNPLQIVGTNLTNRDFRDVFSHAPSGVAALCGVDDGKHIGMVVSSFTSVSIDPPLVSVCIGNQSYTWSRLSAQGHIGISILSADQENICTQLTVHPDDRFTGLDVYETENKGVFIKGAAAWFECDLKQVFPAGDHSIALLSIKAMCAFPKTQPLIFYRSGFHGLKT